MDSSRWRGSCARPGQRFPVRFSTALGTRLISQANFYKASALLSTTSLSFFILFPFVTNVCNMEADGPTLILSSIFLKNLWLEA